MSIKKTPSKSRSKTPKPKQDLQPTKPSFIELEIGEDIKFIIRKTVFAIKSKIENPDPDDPLTSADIANLEKCSKIYATLMSDFRENLKAGVFGDMSDDDLEKFSK